MNDCVNVTVQPKRSTPSSPSKRSARLRLQRLPSNQVVSSAAAAVAGVLTHQMSRKEQRNYKRLRKTARECEQKVRELEVRPLPDHPLLLKYQKSMQHADHAACLLLTASHNSMKFMNSESDQILCLPILQEIGKRCRGLRVPIVNLAPRTQTAVVTQTTVQQKQQSNNEHLEILSSSTVDPTVRQIVRLACARMDPFLIAHDEKSIDQLDTFIDMDKLTESEFNDHTSRPYSRAYRPYFSSLGFRTVTEAIQEIELFLMYWIAVAKMLAETEDSGSESSISLRALRLLVDGDRSAVTKSKQGGRITAINLKIKVETKSKLTEKVFQNRYHQNQMIQNHQNSYYLDEKLDDKLREILDSKQIKWNRTGELELGCVVKVPWKSSQIKRPVGDNSGQGEEEVGLAI